MPFPPNFSWRRLYLGTAVLGLLCWCVAFVFDAKIPGLLGSALMVLGFAAIVTSVFFLWADVSVWLERRRKPESYRDLSATDRGLCFEPLSGQKEDVSWKDIESIKFCRSASMDSLEESWEDWELRLQDGRRIEVGHEPHSRRILLRAFSRYLQGFDSRRARKAMHSNKRGVWVCYETAPDRRGSRPAAPAAELGH